MSSEIGGLGWSLKGRVADATGLVSPKFLRYRPLPVPEGRSSGLLGATPPQAVSDTEPDLLVSMETFSEAIRHETAAGRLPSYHVWRREPVLDEQLIPGASGRTLWNSRYTEIYVHERLLSRR